MDQKQKRAAVIRWLRYLVQDCSTSDAEMVSVALGIGCADNLRSIAQSIISELAERGESK